MRSLFTATALAGLMVWTPLLAQDDTGTGQETATGEAEANYDASTVLANVDGTDITLGHLIVMRSRLPQQYQQVPDDALYAGLLDQLIDQTLLSNAQHAPDAEEATDVRLLLENERRGTYAAKFIAALLDEPLPDEEVQAAYDEAYADFTPQPEFNAAHILVDSEERAQELKAEIDGGADFGELATEHSSDGSAQNGGDLGWFGLGRMVPEFETAVQELEAGEVSDPIQTQFGWHLIKLNETRESAPPPLEEVRAEIEDQLRQQQVQDEVDALRDAATIERPEADIPPSAIRDLDLLSN